MSQLFNKSIVAVILAPMLLLQGCLGSENASQGSSLANANAGRTLVQEDIQAIARSAVLADQFTPKEFSVGQKQAQRHALRVESLMKYFFGKEVVVDKVNLGPSGTTEALITHPKTGVTHTIYLLPDGENVIFGTLVTPYEAHSKLLAKTILDNFGDITSIRDENGEYPSLPFPGKAPSVPSGEQLAEINAVSGSPDLMNDVMNNNQVLGVVNDAQRAASKGPLITAGEADQESKSPNTKDAQIEDHNESVPSVDAIASKHNISKEQAAKVRERAIKTLASRNRLATLPSNNTVTDKATIWSKVIDSTHFIEGSGSKHVYAFFDPNCPACMKAHRIVEEFIHSGEATVHWVPVAIKGRDSADKSRWILASDDKIGEMKRMMVSTPITDLVDFDTLSEEQKDVTSRQVLANNDILREMPKPATPTFVYMSDTGPQITVPANESTIIKMFNNVKSGSD